MRSFQLIAASTALLASVVSAKPGHFQLHPPKSDAVAASNGTSYFEQWIDHKNKSLGTFKQKYYWSDQYCSGSGCPVVLFTPGEVNASGYQGYLSTETITGTFAQAIKGAAVVIEHRYWGDSSPHAQLTTKNMQYLTLENSVADLTNFAQTAKLPWDKAGNSNADKAPWVLSGGSYSGALSAWTASTAPGTFWAYHSSSAPVEAIYNYWQYFEPVQDGMPKNCSKDLSLVIDHIDSVFTNGTKQDQQDLKSMFGLEGVEYADDFGAAIENGPWLWQENNFYGNGGFFTFCDMVEGVGMHGNNTVPGPGGVGLTRALAGYADWFKTKQLPNFCASYGYPEWQGEYNVGCFNTHNASSPIYTDTTLSNGFDRQWQWFLCNQPFGYWQTGAPAGTPSIVSRLTSAEYWQNQCPLYFPPEDGYTYSNRNESQVNAFTKGWDFTNTTRLTWTNGQYDPWRSSGVSSIFRPGGPLQSTANAPVHVIPSGYHCSDLIIENGRVNSGCMDVITAETAQIVQWVKEFHS